MPSMKSSFSYYEKFVPVQRYLIVFAVAEYEEMQALGVNVVLTRLQEKRLSWLWYKLGRMLVKANHFWGVQVFIIIIKQHFCFLFFKHPMFVEDFHLALQHYNRMIRK